MAGLRRLARWRWAIGCALPAAPAAFLAAGLHAQTHPVGLAGNVLDSAGLPVAGVEVQLLEEALPPVFTDSTGEFWLDSVAPGRWSLRFRRLGFGTLLVDFTIPEGRWEEVDLEDVVLPVAEPRSVMLAGLVWEVVGNRPVERALIRAGSTTVAYTGADGRFAGRVAVRGGVALEIARMGLRPARFEVWPGSSDTVSLAIGLRPAAVELGEVLIEGKPAVSSINLDFERHRRAGFGTFLTEERIRNIASFSAVDLLRWAGVQVTGDVFAGSGRLLQMTGTPYSCNGHPPVIFINGRRWPAQAATAYLEVTDPQELAGVEVYRHLGDIPVEYNGPDAECGVVVVWYRP